MSKVTRKVTIHADDPKEGMSALEILTALASAPPDLVPKVDIKINGRILRIHMEVEYAPGT